MPEVIRKLRLYLKNNDCVAETSGTHQHPICGMDNKNKLSQFLIALGRHLTTSLRGRTLRVTQTY